MNDLFGNTESGATFSDCRKYRYALWRIWDKNKPFVMFIGLNPSKANEFNTDNTITKVKKIANNCGYGGFYMMNLFAYVSTDPNKLIACTDNSENNKWLKQIGKQCKDVVFAWGNFKIAKERSKEVIKMFPYAKALDINKNGSPKHPLYCRDDTIPVCYKLAELTINVNHC